MRSLLNEFATLFDLDKDVRGVRLGTLVERAIDTLEEQNLPDWGSPGEAHRFDSVSGGSLDFYYSPHLFPDMDPSLKLGHKLQFYMLPREVPQGAPVSLAAVLESYCHLSGDMFGWEMLADKRFLIWIVDMAGHGVEAGIASALLKILIDNLRQRGEVGSLVKELNDTFIGCLREDRGSLYSTGFFMVLSSDGAVRYTSAGHPPVLVRRANGDLEELASNGIPVGMFPDSEYVAEEMRLFPNDTLLLYTDGVVETTNRESEFFGLDRLRSHLKESTDEPKSLTDTLYRKIAGYQDMAKLDDDVTFVAARMDG
jgi:sigma-B regulation protein RsbU (phosphoserine phosphatase)